LEWEDTMANSTYNCTNEEKEKKKEKVPSKLFNPNPLSSKDAM